MAAKRDPVTGTGMDAPRAPGFRALSSGPNHPRRRSDGCMLPNAGGLVTTKDGAKVTFLLQRRTVFGGNAKGERVGGQNIVMWFEADDERYTWLHDVRCVV